ncbi:PspC domain-containing protein [uncultured Paludibaculum sp.]|uniref:PspC domain-containing protein n=1 Tax=uncultured Paludibaculum sp. TaxID=1765020 RepID=UPI002AAC37BC|nr:PspC domain-containing protein [uncultured Paludibaculum sp.]
MYCTQCGTEMNDQARFCGQCGKSAGGPAASAAPPPFQPQRPLSRDMANKKIAGVCAGLARHFGWDVTLVRVVFLGCFVVHGCGLLAYIIGWICMPRDDVRSFQTAA